MKIWQELGVSGGTAILVLVALYFIIKWAVRSGVTEALARFSPEQPQSKLETLIGSEKRACVQSNPESPAQQEEESAISGLR